MTSPTTFRQTKDLPTPVAHMLRDENWEGLIDALDNGLPANLEGLGDIPLFEHVLFSIESRPRSPGRVDVPAAPEEVLEAFLRNGLKKEGVYQGHSTHVGIAVNYGQWAWARRLIQEGFPVELPGQSVLAAMSSGRLHRALAKGMSEASEDKPIVGDGSGPSTLAVDPLLGSNVRPFPSSAPPEEGFDDDAEDSMQTGSALVFDDTPGERDRLTSMVKDLVAAGASFQARASVDNLLSALESKGQLTPLYHAIYHLDGAMVEALVKAGADLEWRPSDMPYRPLEFAITRGSLDLVEQLIDSGAPVAADPSHEGQAQKLAHPLVLCVRMGLDRLIEPVALAMSKNDLNECGVVAMHIAAANGNIPCMRAVRLMGIPYDAPTQPNGFRPIHQACFAGNEEALAFLLRRGQKWSSTSSSGLTAEDVLGSHHPHLMERFGLSLGGNVRTLFGRKPGPR